MKSFCMLRKGQPALATAQRKEGLVWKWKGRCLKHEENLNKTQITQREMAMDIKSLSVELTLSCGGECKKYVVHESLQ